MKRNERKSFTAKHAKAAEEQKNLAAKHAEDAKEGGQLYRQARKGRKGEQ